MIKDFVFAWEANKGKLKKYFEEHSKAERQGRRSVMQSLYGWEGSEDGMKEIVKGVWLMRLCLFVVMIRTRDRREGTSRVMT